MPRFDIRLLSDRQALMGYFALVVLIPALYTIGTVFRRPYLRMLGLRQSAERDLLRGRTEATEAKATELLILARQFANDWDYGNAIHHGHLLLGRVAMTRGDYDRAEKELIAAGRTPGSPQLDSFGPNCQLALELLQVGRVQPVLEFLRLCDSFWDRDCSRSATWTVQIRQGVVPDFGANLMY
jgi:hypothetical protein